MSNLFKFLADSAEAVVSGSGAGKVAEALGVHVHSNIHDNGIHADITGAAACGASGGEVIGNGVRDVSKLVLDSAEAVVSGSGAGKVAEALGVHVHSNIHDNGIHADVTGPAACGADEVEFKLKARSGGGNFGAKTSGDARWNNASLYRFSAEGDANGVAASCAAGITAKSGFRRVTSNRDIGRVVGHTIEKLLQQDATRISSKIFNAFDVEPEDYIERVTTKLFQKSFNCPISLLFDKLVNELSNGGVKIYVQFTASAEVGFGFKAFNGYNAECELGEEQKDAMQTFKMWASGGECACIPGIEVGMGFSAPGKTWDGNDFGVLFYCGGGVDPCSAMGEVIITVATNEPADDAI